MMWTGTHSIGEWKALRWITHACVGGWHYIVCGPDGQDGPCLHFGNHQAAASSAKAMAPLLGVRLSIPGEHHTAIHAAERLQYYEALESGGIDNDCAARDTSIQSGVDYGDPDGDFVGWDIRSRWGSSLHPGDVRLFGEDE